MKLRSSIIISALLYASSAFAQSSQNFLPPVEGEPLLCTEHHAIDDKSCEPPRFWPTWDRAFQLAFELFRNSRVRLLERAMEQAVISDRVYADGTTPSSAVYWGLREAMASRSSADESRRIIDHWKKSIPGSKYVAIAEARYFYNNAWNFRGSGPIGSVSDESLVLFRHSMEEAEEILQAASIESKRTPYWHNLLLAIAQDNPHGPTKPEAVFVSGVKAFPRYFDLYEVRLSRLVPKWGGSWALVESFVDKWSRELQHTEGSSMYARLYLSLNKQAVEPSETSLNWSRLMKSFSDLTERYPDRKFKNFYAAYACYGRDKVAFRHAISRLSIPELDPDSWLSGQSYESCMRWASI